MNIIEMQNICRSYNNGSQWLTVLKNINLTIASGEMVAITGPSGSGKSTLMNILGCLDVASSGEYLIFGQNAAQLPPDALAKMRREHIGFIFQRYHLMPDLNALGNVEVPAIYASTQCARRRARAGELLQRLGLKGREHHKPGELSGGQQQRVSIARALINGAQVILADEPTGALDSHAGQQVLHILSELHQRGHTVIIVTHDIKVAQHARRIIEIQDGEIVADSGVTHIPQAHYDPPSPATLSRWGGVLDRVRESLRMALNAMNAHRLRTLLTMTGIMFGVAAVATVVALGQGVRQSTLESIQDLGTNVLSIYAGGNLTQDDNRPVRTLTPADAAAIASQPFVDAVSPEMTTNQSVRYLSASSNVSVLGVGRDYLRIQGISLLEGGNFSDQCHACQEVIINENTRNMLFTQHASPVGEIIIIGAVPARVVGVVRNQIHAPPNQLSVWMPWSTVMHRMTGQTSFSSISVHLKDTVASGVAVDSINQLLSWRHGVKDFMVFNRDQLRKSIEQTSARLNLLIFTVAAIALMIGCLSVMNIMLVSVTERTHEIGIRMATGARNSDIMQQFIIEAVLVCLAGGALGVVLSLILSSMAEAVLTVPGGGMLRVIYSWDVAILAFICSTLIGVIFGYLPARKAARMNPVTALASE